MQRLVVVVFSHQDGVVLIQDKSFGDVFPMMTTEQEGADRLKIDLLLIKFVAKTLFNVMISLHQEFSHRGEETASYLYPLDQSHPSIYLNANQIFNRRNSAN